MLNDNTRKKHSDTFEYIIVALTVLYSGSVLATTSNKLYGYGLYAFALLAFITWVKDNNWKLKFSNRARVFFFIWMGLLILNFVFHVSTESMAGFISSVSYPLLAYSIVELIGYESFFKKYVNVIFFLSALSLLFFYFIQNTGLFNVFPYVQGAYSGDYFSRYRGFILYYSLDPLRNNGCFWEPGVFATHLIFALLLSVKYTHKPKAKTIHILVFVITILSTRSTAGYVLLMLSAVFIASYRINRIEAGVTRIASSIISLGLIFVLVYIYFNIQDILTRFGLQNELMYAKLLNVSDNSRIQSITWNFERFLEKPFIGYGKMALNDLNRSVDATTTTSVKLMAAYGFMGISYTIAMINGAFRQKQISFLTKISFIFIWLIITNKEGADSFVFSWILIFYLLTSDYVLASDGRKTDLPEQKWE